MRLWAALVAAALMAGCGGVLAPGDEVSTYTSQYLDVHKDEAKDRIVVDDVRMTRGWNYIQLKSTQATLHAAVNQGASKAVRHAVLDRPDTFVILGEPSANIKDGDYVSLCGMSGTTGRAIGAVSIIIGDSGSNEDLVAVALNQIAACA